MELRVKTKFRGSERAAQQIIGREGETATLFGRFFFHINLRVSVSPHVNSIVRHFRLKPQPLILKYFDCLYL